MSGVSLYDGLKLFPAGDERISAKEMTELVDLGFRRDDIDEYAVYQLHDLEPYQDLTLGRPGVTAMRSAWRQFSMSGNEELLQWSADGHKYLVDMFFVDNHPDEIPLLQVFGSIPLSPRATRVASTMIEWLGTPVGQSFLLQAENYYKKIRNLKRSDAYALLWIQENSVLRSHSGREDLAQVFARATDKSAFMDAEVMTQVMLWIGSDRGQDMIKNAREMQAEIQREYLDEFRGLNI
jgi:hypothetical protein